MLGGGRSLVTGEDVGDRSKVEAGASSEPVEVADNEPEVGLSFGENGRGKVRGRRDHVDGVTRAVRGQGWGLVGEVKGGKEGIDGSFLGEMDINMAGRMDGGCDFVAKEMCRVVGKVDKHGFSELETGAESTFNSRGLAEVDKVVDIHPDVDGGMIRKKGAGEDTGCIRKRKDAHVSEDRVTFLIPVAR